MAVSERAVLTLATGKDVYFDMALSLARSFARWNDPDKIGFTIATDCARKLPKSLQWVTLHIIEKGIYGEGFSPKLYLDLMMPATRTLFVDADCLIVRSLDPVFEAFTGRAVSTVGRMESNGDWWGEIADRCRRFNIEAIPIFVGVMYYLEKGEKCSRVFESARSLVARYDELGFVRLRGFANEEVLVSLTMAQHGLMPLPDDGSIKADAIFFRSVKMDVLEGYARFEDAESWLLGTAVSEASPVIAHFNDKTAFRVPYTREAVRLKKVVDHGWPVQLATIFAISVETFPEWTIKRIRKLFRPFYRRFFGVRPVMTFRRTHD